MNTLATQEQAKRLLSEKERLHSWHTYPAVIKEASAFLISRTYIINNPGRPIQGSAPDLIFSRITEHAFSPKTFMKQIILTRDGQDEISGDVQYALTSKYFGAVTGGQEAAREQALHETFNSKHTPEVPTRYIEAALLIAQLSCFKEVTVIN